jgi:hypothetical protein
MATEPMPVDHAGTCGYEDRVDIGYLQAGEVTGDELVEVLEVPQPDRDVEVCPSGGLLTN